MFLRGQSWCVPVSHLTLVTFYFCVRSVCCDEGLLTACFHAWVEFLITRMWTQSSLYCDRRVHCVRASDTSLISPFQFLQGNTEVFPGWPRDMISLTCPRSAPGSLPRWTCPEHLLHGVVQDPSDPNPDKRFKDGQAEGSSAPSSMETCCH